MKKALLILFATFLLFTSCKQGLEGAKDKEEYGKILINMEGGHRLYSIGDNGLPDIRTSKMMLKIEAEGREPIEKTFEEDEAKSYEGKFKIGTKLDISITIIGKVSEWSGKSSITVTEGDNPVSIRVEKAAKVLGALKFSFTRDAMGATKFELGFEGDAPFFNTNISGQNEGGIPSFCRDQKGRIYISYDDAEGGVSKRKIVRYTSEGEKDTKFTEYENTREESIFMTSDMKSGNVFAVFSIRTSADYGTKVALVKDDELTYLTPDISGLDLIHSVASYDNILAIVGMDGASKQLVMKFYQHKDDKIEEVQGLSYDLGNDLSCKVKEEGGDESTIYATISDVLMNSKNIYCLLNIRDISRKINISTGKILQYEYNIGTKSISSSKVLVGRSEYEVKDRVVNVKDENKEVYGPLKFVGFNEEKLFIADDGVVQVYDAGEARVKENKNRLVYVSLKDGSFGVEKADIASWLIERKAIDKPVESMVFFNKKMGGAGAAGKTQITLKSTSDDGEIKIDGNKVLEFLTDDLDYTFDGEGDFYVVAKNVCDRYIHKVEGTSISYTKDTSFYAPPSVSDDNSQRILYDRKTKDLYYYCIKGINKKLFRRYENGWNDLGPSQGVEAMIGSKDLITIYNDVLYSASLIGGSFKVRSAKIKDDTVISEDNAIDLELARHNPPHNMVAFDNVLYITYTKSSRNALPTLHILTIDLSNKEKKTHDVKIEDVPFCKFRSVPTYYIGSKKDGGKVFFALDGAKYLYDSVRIVDNINRYMSVKYDGGVVNVEIEDVPSGIVWGGEEVLWKGTVENILWKADPQDGEAMSCFFYGVPQNTFNSFDDTNADLFKVEKGTEDYKLSNRFCYDQNGNLYVIYKNVIDGWLARLKLQNDGTYNFEKIKDRIQNGSFTTDYAIKLNGFFYPIEDGRFVTVDTNKVNSQGENVTYVYTPHDYSNTNKVLTIARHVVKESSEAVADPDMIGGNNSSADRWKLDVPLKVSDNVERSVVAFSANKDGFFIAIKETEWTKNKDETKRASYNIQVRKYSNENKAQNYTAPLSVIDLVGTPTNRVSADMFDSNEKPTPDNAKDENIKDMITYDGKLYVLGILKTGNVVDLTIDQPKSENPNEIKISGTLWDLGSTEDFKADNKKVIKTSVPGSVESGKFAPCHVVGLLPNGFHIASDGYYGNITKKPYQFKNYDNVWTFTLPKKKDETEKLESSPCKARFNLHLKDSDPDSSEFGWDSNL